MKFCPECGTAVEGEPKFCPECGEALQPKEASPAEEPPVTSGTDPAPTPTESAPAKRNMMPFIIGAIALLLVIAVGVIVFGGNGDESSSESPEDSIADAIDAENMALASALKYLNTEGQYATSTFRTMTQRPDLPSPYVSVGYAADYPDQVLVTVVSQAAGAYQVMFVPGETDANWMTPNNVNATALPDSVKNWNATIDENGYVLLNGYERESLPDSSGSSSAPSSDEAPSEYVETEEEEPVSDGLMGSSHKDETVHLVVFASETDREIAEQKYAQIVEMLGDPYLAQTIHIVDSSDFEGLNPGYLVVIMPCEEQMVAEGEAEYFRGFDLDAYVKQVVVKTDVPLTLNTAVGD